MNLQELSLISLRVYSGEHVCASEGQIIANRPWVEGFEVFKVIHLGSNRVAFQTHEGLYFCAGNDPDSTLVANRQLIGPWETFEIIHIPNHYIALRAWNGRYVAAEKGGGEKLVANRSTIGDWEKFYVGRVMPNQHMFRGSVIASYSLVDLTGGQVSVLVNDSDHDVFIKPENSTKPVKIKPKTQYHSGFDGIAMPEKHPGCMIKFVDSCDAIVSNEKIEVNCRDIKIGAISIPWSGINGQLLKGGWLTQAPDAGWKELEEISKTKPSSSTTSTHDRFPNANEPGLSPRERFERTDRNQYETERAERTGNTC